MKIKKDSLLFKTILYNNLSMFLTGLTIIGILVTYSFKELEKNFSLKAVEKTQVANDLLEFRNIEVTKDFIHYINSDEFLEGPIFDFDEKKEKEIFSKLRSKMLSENIGFYKNSTLIILGEKGKALTKNGVIYGSKERFTKNLTGITNRLTHPIDSIMYDEKGGFFYYEVIVPVKNNSEVEAVIINTPIKGDALKGNKYLMILNHKNIKDLGLYRENMPSFLDKREIEKLEEEDPEIVKIKNDDYKVRTLSLDGIDHNIVSIPIHNYLGERIGYLIVTMAEPGLTKFKIYTMSIIILITILLISLNSFVITETFKQLLMPLEELSDAVDDIASGNLDRTLRLNGTDEIKVLSLATKKMVETLKKNNLVLENQNQKLKDHIKRVEGVEQLLVDIRRATEDCEVMDIVLKGFTSEVGLNYDRAMFFKYSSETGQLLGKKISKNKHILKTDKLSSFDLRYETMKDIVPLIRIKNDDNLFNEAVTKREIIFKNTRGYKFYLGSELLKGFGLKNFMILPVLNKNKTIGCILIDNYISGRRIEIEDVELFNVILLNLEIHYENQQIRQKNINSQRDIAIGRMFEKIISRRNKVIEKYATEILNQYKENKIEHSEFMKFRDIICSITREDSILFDYSDKKEYNFRKLKLNQFLPEVVESYVRNSTNNDISLFLGDNVTFLGDPVELTKALREIINNSINAIKGVANGRINIISRVYTDNITIRIIDNGCGIPKKLLEENLFEPFTSGNENTSGLGLTIAYKIITSHNGVIKIISNENKGTEVKIILNKYKEAINV